MPLIRYNPQFLLSALDAAQFPAPTVPEIAFLGRSNVGKSSLPEFARRRKGRKSVANAWSYPRHQLFRVARSAAAAQVDLRRSSRVRLRENLEIHFERNGRKFIDPYLAERETLRPARLPCRLKHTAAAKRRKPHRLVCVTLAGNSWWLRPRPIASVATHAPEICSRSRTHSIWMKSCPSRQKPAPVLKNSGTALKPPGP